MRPVFNDLAKDSVRRALAKLGVRLQKAIYLPYSYERRNYSGSNIGRKPVIFDIGANIGQSATWYAHEFPEAEIRCFEPFESVYAMLKKSVGKNSQIIPHQLALGQSQQRIQVPRIVDPLCQTGSIEPNHQGVELEWIDIDTVDNFASHHEIEAIYILKTDTEGHDLEVLDGAERMLNEKRISHIISEATILPNDSDHTQLKALESRLSSKGMYLRSLLDLHHHPESGDLLYFNALFSAKAAHPRS